MAVAQGDRQEIFHGCVRERANRLTLAQAVAEAFGYIRSTVPEATAEDVDVTPLGGELSSRRDSRHQMAQSEARLNCTNMGLCEGLEEYRRQPKYLQRR